MKLTAAQIAAFVAHEFNLSTQSKVNGKSIKPEVYRNRVKAIVDDAETMAATFPQLTQEQVNSKLATKFFSVSEIEFQTLVANRGYLQARHLTAIKVLAIFMKYGVRLVERLSSYRFTTEEFRKFDIVTNSQSCENPVYEPKWTCDETHVETKGYSQDKGKTSTHVSQSRYAGIAQPVALVSQQRTGSDRRGNISWHGRKGQMQARNGEVYDVL